MLRIGLDLINQQNLVGGGGRFARQLIEGLMLMDSQNEYVLFVNERVANEISVYSPKFCKHVVRTPQRRFAPWNQIYFAINRKLLQNIDLLHSLASASPIFAPQKTVVTVHDIEEKVFPKAVGWKARAWRNLIWPLALRWANHIVAVSESTKRGLMQFYGIREGDITVIPHYCSLNFQEATPEALEDLRARYGLPRRYILHVGLPYKRKNHKCLIDAFGILKRRAKVPHKLVLVGPQGWEDLKVKVGELNLQDEVIFTGLVPDGDLALIYSAADLFVFPSFYEGFGYPPLEAMACGTPVIVSNTSSLPEVVGEAGLYVNPGDPEDIAEKMLKVLESPDLAIRMRALGFKQAQKSSLEKMIQGYLEVYQKVGKMTP